MKLTYHDDSHRYYLDGKRCKSASAIAKRLEDGYRLDLWKQRQVAIGIATHPALIDRIAAHFDDRDALNTIVEEAHTHAKTQQAAERGTAMHRFTERADNNEAILATELATATIHAWRTALDEAGLDVVDGWTETIVAYPDSLVCGRMDRIVRRRADGRMFILDLKTGAKALSYPHAIAVQLALYANAPVAYIIDGQSGSSDKMLTLPAELDKDIALVFAMPTPEEWSIVPVRIDSAWRVAQDAILGPFGALAWEKADDLVLPAIVEHTPPTAPLDPADDPFAGITPDTDPPADEGALVEPATPEVAATTSGELDVPPAYTTREWILERVRQLAAIHPEALTALAGEWPTGVPGLASKAMLSPAEWKLVDAAVAKIETAVEAPFVPGPRNHEGDGWVSQMAAAIGHEGHDQDQQDGRSDHQHRPDTARPPDTRAPRRIRRARRRGVHDAERARHRTAGAVGAGTARGGPRRTRTHRDTPRALHAPRARRLRPRRVGEDERRPAHPPRVRAAPRRDVHRRPAARCHVRHPHTRTGDHDAPDRGGRHDRRVAVPVRRPTG